MRPGALDEVVELQNFTLSTDGDPTSGTWATVHTVRAEWIEGSRIEQFVGAAETATAVGGWGIRYVTGLDPTWRVKHGTELWDIEGVAKGRNRNRELILAVSRHDPGDRSA